MDLMRINFLFISVGKIFFKSFKVLKHKSDFNINIQ